jgi:hypothetical protein
MSTGGCLHIAPKFGYERLHRKARVLFPYYLSKRLCRHISLKQIEIDFDQIVSFRIVVRHWRRSDISELVKVVRVSCLQNDHKDKKGAEGSQGKCFAPRY